MAGGNGEQKKHGFYPTTPGLIYALFETMRAEGWSGSEEDVWECACGAGAMSEILKFYFRNVHSTDLIDRGYGEGGVDFLKTTKLLAPNIVTNPPFALAEEFIRHAHDLGASNLILLLKSTYWHAASRIPLFEECKPRVIAPLTTRLDTTGQGRPTMEVTWFVWTPLNPPERALYRSPLKKMPPPMEAYL